MISKALFRFGFVFLACSIACIKGNNTQAQPSWGVRVGLNAVSIMNYKVYQDNEILSNTSYDNKNGYLIAGFARFKINRIFLQPEFAWNEYRRTCSFAFPIENSNSHYPPIHLDIGSKVINTNFLVGYNMVHDYPFLFGVYAGSSFFGTYRTDFSMESETSFSNTKLYLNYSSILGFSINIYQIYFDLRYELSLPNSNLNLRDIPIFTEKYQDANIKKMEAILSFSFGVMF